MIKSEQVFYRFKKNLRRTRLSHQRGGYFESIKKPLLRTRRSNQSRFFYRKPSWMDGLVQDKWRFPRLTTVEISHSSIPGSAQWQTTLENLSKCKLSSRVNISTHREIRTNPCVPLSQWQSRCARCFGLFQTQTSRTWIRTCRSQTLAGREKSETALFWPCV